MSFSCNDFELFFPSSSDTAFRFTEPRPPCALPPPTSPQRPTTRNLKPLLRLLGFVRPYLGRVLLAVLALLVAAGAVLAFGQVIREVVDSGLKTGSEAALNRSLLALPRRGADHGRGHPGPLLSAELDRRAGHRRYPRGGLRPGPGAGRGLLRDHPHRGDHLAPDLGHHPAPDRGRLHPGHGPAHLAAGHRRARHAGPDQPPPDRTGAARHAAGDPAPVADRLPPAAPVPGQPGPHRRRRGLCGRGAPRHPHRPGLLSRGHRPGALPRAGGGGLRHRPAPRPPECRPGRHRHGPDLRCHRRRPVGRRARGAGGPAERRANCPPSSSTPCWWPVPSAA